MKTFDNVSVNINAQFSPARQSPRPNGQQEQIDKLNQEIKEKQREY